MTRIECETATQCEQIAETMHAVIPQAVTALLTLLVVGIALYVAHREVTRYNAA